MLRRRHGHRRLMQPRRLEQGVRKNRGARRPVRKRVPERHAAFHVLSGIEKLRRRDLVQEKHRMRIIGHECRHLAGEPDRTAKVVLVFAGHDDPRAPRRRKEERLLTLRAPCFEPRQDRADHTPGAVPDWTLRLGEPELIRKADAVQLVGEESATTVFRYRVKDREPCDKLLLGRDAVREKLEKRFPRCIDGRWEGRTADANRPRTELRRLQGVP